MIMAEVLAAVFCIGEGARDPSFYQYYFRRTFVSYVVRTRLRDMEG